MSDLINHLKQVFKDFSPNLISAFIILIVGWLIAYGVSILVKSILRRTNLDNKLISWMGGNGNATANAESVISKIIYYIILLFVVIQFLQTLGLNAISDPLKNFQNQVFLYAPRILSAGLLIFIAWIIATAVKYILSNVLGGLNLDEKLNRSIAKKDEPFEENTVESTPSTTPLLSNIISNTIYWLIFLFFLPSILDALDLQGILGPVRDMLNKILSYVPSFAGAILILVVGWFIAKIIQNIVTNLISSTGIDNISSNRSEISSVVGNLKVSSIIGQIVQILILIPVFISALNALALQAISVPAINMLNKILDAVPNILSAAILLFIAYIIAKFIQTIVTNLLTSAGFDKFIYNTKIIPSRSKTTPSQIIGIFAMIFVIVFLSIQSLQLLGFGSISQLIVGLTVFTSNIVVGLIIIGIGLYLSNISSKAIKSSGVSEGNLLSIIARVFILFLTVSIALNRMGLANDIVNLAFGLVLGAIAIASALAFGLGGREAAGKIMNNLVSKYSSTAD